MFIYLLTNTINGKYYVGKTTNRNLNRYLSNKRCLANKREKYKQNFPIIKAMAKHGVDKFVVDVLAQPKTIEELDNLEKIWIILLNSTNPTLGYNILLGGSNGRRGLPLPEETKQKIRQANKGRKPKGYIRTEVHLQQLRDRMKGNLAGKKITSEIAAKWKAMETDEQRVARFAKIKQSWDNYTPEQRAARIAKMGRKKKDVVEVR